MEKKNHYDTSLKVTKVQINKTPDYRKNTNNENWRTTKNEISLSNRPKNKNTCHNM
jgi:hypothetical protein